MNPHQIAVSKAIQTEFTRLPLPPSFLFKPSTSFTFNQANGGGTKSSNSGGASRAGGAGVRQRRSTAAPTRRPLASTAPKSPVFLFYSEDSPGIKVGPVPVLVMCLCFIVSVFLLHFWGKYTRSA